MLGLRRKTVALEPPAEHELGRFRALEKTDLRAILAIENRSYEFPWSKGVFADCIRVGYRCRVLELERGIASYGIMSVAAQESHILNLCVRPEWHGRGLAKRMLEHLLTLAKQSGAHTTFLEVRPSNTTALHLYQTAGFCEVGLRREYYPGSQQREDALVMAKTLLDS